MNHSPQVVFEPSNELDDYTNATLYINEEKEASNPLKITK